MSFEQRDVLINKLNVLADNVEERWQTLTNKQVQELEDQIEKCFGAVCRRNK